MYMMNTSFIHGSFAGVDRLPWIRKTLRSWGWSLLPIPHRQKHPDGPWREWQSRIATDEEMQGWAEKGIGVVCGDVSGNLVCLDFDDREEYNLWVEDNKTLAAKLPTAETSRGMHVFFRTPELVRNSKFVRTGSNTIAGDLLAHSKIAVLPPTIHPTGRERVWVVEPVKDLPVLPLEQAGVAHAATPSRLIEIDPELETVQEGMRHSALVDAAMRLRSAGFGSAQLQTLLERFNTMHCNPPVDGHELLGIAKWVALLEDRQVRIIKRQNEEGKWMTQICPDDTARYDEAFEPGNEYVKAKDEAFEWLIDGFLPTGYLVVLGGTSKAGKSCFLTALAIALAKGEDFLGLKVPEPVPVLWCAFEESRGERAMTLSAHDEVPAGLLVTHSKPLIDTPDGLALLRHNVRKHKARLIVVDPLYGANAAESLTDGKSARNALQGLKDLCNEENVTAIIIHHLTKNVGAGLVRERMADSNQILATASMDILMDSKEVSDGRQLTLKCRGRGSFANQTWVVLSRSVTEYELVPDAEVEVKPLPTAKSLIVERLGVGRCDAETLMDCAKVSYSRVCRLLGDLVQEGVVVMSGKIGNRKQYQLKGDVPEIPLSTS